MKSGPLSRGQEVLWLLDRTAEGVVAYNVPRALRVRGALDVPALERAFAGLVARHGVLRTRFIDGPEGPVQVEEASAEFHLERESIATPDAAAVEQWLAAHAREPIDLTRAPQLRAILARVAEDDHVLLVMMHHIVTDGVSKGILWRELAALYDAALDGSESGLPPVQGFLETARLARAREESGGFDREVQYWSSQLADAPRALDLPTDAPRGESARFEGARVVRPVSAATAAAVASLAKQGRCTPFMVWLAGWQLLLGRYAGAEDVVTGTPISGREGEDDQSVLGNFTNMVAVRTRLPVSGGFAGLLASVKDTMLDALEHQAIPFEQVEGALAMAREGVPLFNTMFLFEREDRSAIRLGQATANPIIFETGWTKYDLTLALVAHDERLLMSAQYRVDRFTESTALRMLESLELLLQDAAARPEAALATLNILSPRERRLVVETWNDTARPYPAGETLVDLLHAQVERTPHAVALECTETRLTFAELAERGRLLGGWLQREGVGPGTLVGLCLERSIEMVVAIIGVLEAGGAYVPMDPEYPTERLAFMLRDANAPVVLTQEHLRAQLAAADARVVSLDSDWDRIAGVKQSPHRSAGPDDPAYMIYTSGSTGQPKGALNSHRGIVNRLRWMQDEYALTAADAVLQKTPFSFDVSVWEFLWPLISGARLVMAAPGGHRDPQYLSQIIAVAGITVLHFVPAMLRAWLDTSPEAGRCSSLRDVICSGEALPVDLTTQFFAVLPQARLHNLYGPTEAAIDVSYWACRRDETRRSVPIGRPVANTQLYVLDAAGTPTPVGVPGELYIAGVQVGMGYHGRAELTAERFVSDPFSGRAGARMYRTGDRARWTAGGVVEYLGRTDFQVKLRGFRIELGEVEAAIASLPGVRQAVAVVRDIPPRGDALVAYYLAEPTAQPADALLSLLRSRVPGHLVPNHLVLLEQFPLSPNGKVDRARLPLPASAGESAGNAATVPPRTAMEMELAAIWSALLNREVVGIRDDLLGLGVHSLLAMRVAAAVTRQTGVQVPMHLVLQSRTIEVLARKITELQERGDRSQRDEAVPFTHADREGELPLSSAQELVWLFEQMRPGTATYQVPMLYRVRGQIDWTSLGRALDNLAARHEGLRMTFADRRGVPTQSVAAVGTIPLLINDLRGAPDAVDREATALTFLRGEAARPFDLAAGPLLRATAARLRDDDQFLLLVAHHIAVDGTSAAVLARDLDELYVAALTGREAVLPELDFQYADFAHWQRRYLTAERRERMLGYWRQALDGAPRKIALPSAGSGAGAPGGASGREVKVLSPSLSEDLARLARETGTTPFMLMLAGFQVALALLSGENDLVVGVPVAGRTRPEVQDLVGYFVNTLPLRLTLDRSHTFRQVLGQVRARCLDAFEHQELPLAELVRDQHRARPDSEAGLFSAMFVFQDGEGAGLRLGPLELEAVAVDLDNAKFDLTCSVSQGVEGLRTSLQYRRGVFNAPAAQEFLEGFERLLRDVVADAAVTVSGLSANDTRALSIPGGLPRPGASAGRATPATTDPTRATAGSGRAVDEVIAGIWAEVLGIAAVDLDRNFFDLGGHSLLATQVVSRVTATLRVHASLRTFFGAPTVRNFADALIAQETTAGQTEAVARAVLKLRGMSPAERARRGPGSTPSASSGQGNNG